MLTLTFSALRDPSLRLFVNVTVLACKNRESAPSFKFLVGPELLADPVGKCDYQLRLRLTYNTKCNTRISSHVEI
jgi:hypothetical protein